MQKGCHMDEKDIAKVKRVQQYALNMRPIMNKESLFSDETENYRTPFEPEVGDRVTIKFRTARDNVDYVFIICGSRKVLMQKAYTKGAFDYYTYTTDPLKEGTLHYYFEIYTGKQRCFYNELGVSKDLQEVYSFGIVPGFKTPDWAKGAIMYQIFTDRFCNGDPSNDVLDREYIYINEGVIDGANLVEGDINDGKWEILYGKDVKLLVTI